jgi:hypothetical protein
VTFSIARASLKYFQINARKAVRARPCSAQPKKIALIQNLHQSFQLPAFESQNKSVAPQGGVCGPSGPGGSRSRPVHKKIINYPPQCSTIVLKRLFPIYSRLIPGRPNSENERPKRSVSTWDRYVARLYKPRPRRESTKQQYRQVRACPWLTPVFEWFETKLAEKKRQIIAE